MHVIRLHGPWTAEVWGPEVAETRRVHLPRDWPALTETARHSLVTLSRRFHRPTGLEAATRISLAIPRGWPVVVLTLNGDALSSPELREERLLFDLSDKVRLREAHDLRIELECGEGLIAQPYFVAFEITDDGVE